MAFYGTTFIFDGIPSEEFGLYLYDFADNAQADGKIGSTVEIHENRLWDSYLPIHYGVSENKAMEFDLICSVDSNEHRLDRFDLAKISGWLKQPGYRYLQIVQPDYEQFRYKSIVSDIELITVGLDVIGLKIHVVCDGPYAYFAPEEIEFTCNNTLFVPFNNRSNINRYYYPKMVIETDGGDIKITNKTDGDREFILSGLPTSTIAITIDGANSIITSNSDLNVYDHFNFCFVRCVRGNNNFSLSGNFKVKFLTEFPVDIGY